MAEEIIDDLNQPDDEDQDTYHLQAREPVTLQVIHSETLRCTQGTRVLEFTQTLSSR